MQRCLLILAILQIASAQVLEFIWAEGCPSCDTSCPNMSKVVTSPGVCYNAGYATTSFGFESALVTSCTVRNETGWWSSVYVLFPEPDCNGVAIYSGSDPVNGTEVCDVGVGTAIVYGCFEVPPSPPPPPSGPSDNTIMAIIFIPIAIAAVVIILLLRIAPTNMQRARSI